jgi:type IV secretion system protein VirD4
MNMKIKLSFKAWTVLAVVLSSAIAWLVGRHITSWALLVLAVAVVILVPSRHLPRHRSRRARIRVHLRLHPGHGFASTLELWLRWSRFASFRESGRSRPSLSAWQRIRRPDTHSVFLGRAHGGHGLRLPVQEHACLVGPPRVGKSGLMSRVIMHAPGSVVSTSSKPDMFGLTSGIRARRGPVFVFNPQGIGGVPSNIRWNPVEGCIDEATAIRRADAFANAVSTKGADDSEFWSGQASDHLRSMFTAAAFGEAGMGLVSSWVLGGSVADPVAFLHQCGREQWARSLAQLDGAADKTNATVRMVMRRALAYTGDPALLLSTAPAEGENFDIDEFLKSGGTLYMVAKGDGKDSALGPLFAALASEIQYRATLLGSQNKNGGRLDPPLLMALDEITQICPVPLPRWLADSGGLGVQVISAFHGIAQLVERWGLSGAQIIMDTSGCKVFYPGLSDAQTLKGISDLTGQHALRTRGQDGEHHYDVVTAELARRMPPGFGLLVRGGNAPVIAKLARGWKDRLHKKACKAHTDVAQLPAARPDMLTCADLAAFGAPDDARELDGTGLADPDADTPWE